MKPPPLCPRCGGALRAPGLMSSAWLCDEHGSVLPYHRPPASGDGPVRVVVEQAKVPAWLPWPLPSGWLLTGAAWAGDERTGARAVALACSGPAPFGGVGELLLVSEEPGIGLGAWLAGMAGPDPGPGFASGTPGARVMTAGWPTPLWSLDDPDQPRDRAVWVGEAAGAWLWLVAWPETTDLLLHEGAVRDSRPGGALTLLDLRDPGFTPDLPHGALSPRLTPSPLS